MWVLANGSSHSAFYEEIYPFLIPHTIPCCHSFLLKAAQNSSLVKEAHIKMVLECLKNILDMEVKYVTAHPSQDKVALGQMKELGLVNKIKGLKENNKYAENAGAILENHFPEEGTVGNELAQNAQIEANNSALEPGMSQLSNQFQHLNLDSVNQNSEMLEVNEESLNEAIGEMKLEGVFIT